MFGADGGVVGLSSDSKLRGPWGSNVLNRTLFVGHPQPCPDCDHSWMPNTPSECGRMLVSARAPDPTTSAAWAPPRLETPAWIGAVVDGGLPKLRPAEDGRRRQPGAAANAPATTFPSRVRWRCDSPTRRGCRPTASAGGGRRDGVHRRRRHEHRAGRRHAGRRLVCRASVLRRIRRPECQRQVLQDERYGGTVRGLASVHPGGLPAAGPEPRAPGRPRLSDDGVASSRAMVAPPPGCRLPSLAARAPDAIPLDSHPHQQSRRPPATRATRPSAGWAVRPRHPRP